MSSVSVERSFSLIRHVHTWKRNRLGRDKLAMLIYVKFNRNWEYKCGLKSVTLCTIEHIIDVKVVRTFLICIVLDCMDDSSNFKSFFTERSAI